MKQTELDRKERDLRKERKRLLKESNRRKDTEADDSPVLTTKTAYDRLISLFDYDDEEIYNIHRNNENLVEVLLEMQEALAKSDFESTLRKAIKRTRVKQKEQAFKAVSSILGI